MSNLIDDIYQVFKDYYGESKVDLQYPEGKDYCDIIVFWDKVTITNEYDESVDIYHLYAKIKIDKTTGKLLSNPVFIRSQYTEDQWNGRYVHSHIPALGRSDMYSWHSSCLGSGPINRTISKLKGTDYMSWNESILRHEAISYSTEELWKDMMTWTLFCFELDKYVQVESVAGTPYYRMSNINSRRVVNNSKIDITIQTSYTSHWPFRTMMSFINYLLSKRILRFSYLNNSFILGMSPTEAIMAISNTFIDWYNNTDNDLKETVTSQDLFESGLLKSVTMINNTLYGETRESYSLPNIITQLGHPLGFKFKGEEVVLSLKGVSNNISMNQVTILDPQLISNIIYKILRFVNYKYGKSQSKINQKDRIL